MSEGGEEEVKDEFVLTIERNNGKTTIIGVGGKSAEKYGILKGEVLTGGDEEDGRKINETEEELSNVAVVETVVEERESNTDRPIGIKEKIIEENKIEENKIEEKAQEAATEQNDFTIADGIIEKIKKIEIKDKDGNPIDSEEVTNAFNKIKQNEIYKYYNSGVYTYTDNKRNLFEVLIANIFTININIDYKIKGKPAYQEYITEKMTNDTIKLLKTMPDKLFNEPPTSKMGGYRKSRTQKRRRNQKPRKGGKSRRNVHKK